MQHLNPPPSFVPPTVADEIRKLESTLAELVGQRNRILDEIGEVHSRGLDLVNKAIASFERDFRASNHSYLKLMDEVNRLRGLNDPLRKQIWDLKAKINEIKPICPVVTGSYHAGGRL